MAIVKRIKIVPVALACVLLSSILSPLPAQSEPLGPEEAGIVVSTLAHTYPDGGCAPYDGRFAGPGEYEVTWGDKEVRVVQFWLQEHLSASLGDAYMTVCIELDAPDPLYYPVSRDAIGYIDFWDSGRRWVLSDFVIEEYPSLCCFHSAMVWARYDEYTLNDVPTGESGSIHMTYHHSGSYTGGPGVPHYDELPMTVQPTEDGCEDSSGQVGEPVSGEFGEESDPTTHGTYDVRVHRDGDDVEVCAEVTQGHERHRRVVTVSSDPGDPPESPVHVDDNAPAGDGPGSPCTRNVYNSNSPRLQIRRSSESADQQAVCVGVPGRNVWVTVG